MIRHLLLICPSDAQNMPGYSSDLMPAMCFGVSNGRRD